MISTVCLFTAVTAAFASACAKTATEDVTHRLEEELAAGGFTRPLVIDEAEFVAPGSAYADMRSLTAIFLFPTCISSLHDVPSTLIVPATVTLDRRVFTYCVARVNDANVSYSTTTTVGADNTKRAASISCLRTCDSGAVGTLALGDMHQAVSNVANDVQPIFVLRNYSVPRRLRPGAAAALRARPLPCLPALDVPSGAAPLAAIGSGVAGGRHILDAASNELGMPVDPETDDLRHLSFTSGHRFAEEEPESADIGADAQAAGRVHVHIPPAALTPGAIRRLALTGLDGTPFVAAVTVGDLRSHLAALPDRKSVV
eukprot:TRINITY_DN2781_c0_g1_i1.p1 TRINITY_DN2781_c0_g1~~TRINITY_DN2781_c0_g1_i1.p1  ORF type:complete len:315 (+),score=55.33 TRINITY_DN2781_c0_g1_i1:222-1166(+)